MRSDRRVLVGAGLLLGAVVAWWAWPAAEEEAPTLVAARATPAPPLRQAPPAAGLEAQEVGEQVVRCPMPASSEGEEVLVMAAGHPGATQTALVEGGEVELFLPEVEQLRIGLDIPGYDTVFAEVEAGRCRWMDPPARKVPLILRRLAEDGGETDARVVFLGCGNELQSAIREGAASRPPEVALPAVGSCRLDVQQLVPVDEGVYSSIPLDSIELSDRGQEQVALDVVVPDVLPSAPGLVAGREHNGELGDVVIHRVFPGTLAEEIGLKRDDRLLSIDGEPTAEMDSHTVMLHLLGDQGSEATLLVQDETGVREVALGREPWLEP